MTKRLVTVVVAGALFAVVASGANAQVVGQDASVLQGVDAIDAQVSITWVDAITKDGGPTETQYEEAFTAEFRAGLIRGGLSIDTSAPNYLYCSIALVFEENGLVSAAQAVELHEMLGPENQWAITWTQMQVFQVGLQNFSGQDDAQWCHQSFMQDWRNRNGG